MDSDTASLVNKRIAKNTMMLYFRMLLVLIVTFFTFRLLLRELGEEGYGSYNVVGGIVILFSFLSSALTQSTQRYLSYYLGKNDAIMLRKIFSTSINVHLLISGIVLLLAETIGLWFLKTKMSFPPETLSSVNWMYQCSIVAFIMQIMTVPFQAVIISHEKMSFYAYFSIIEVSLKLSAVLVLFLFATNKLIVYSVAIVFVYAIVWFCYCIYCHKAFGLCNYSWIIEKKIFKELTSFSGWNMLGGIGNVGATQGVNVIFNIFCGVIVNAAMGVANQVGGAVSSFVSNLQIAFNPQIVKSYAEGEYDRFNTLIFRSSRFSFLLIFTLGLPVIICCKPILNLWLTDVPQYAIPFTRLMICFCMIDAISGPLWTAAQASGKIKGYMLLIATMIFSNVPAAYLLLKIGFSPVWIMGYKVAMNIFIHIFRIIYLNRIIKFPSLRYCKDVIIPIVLYVIICIPLPLILLKVHDSVIWNSGIFIITVLECGILGFFIMLTSHERIVIASRIKSRLLSSYKKPM